MKTHWLIIIRRTLALVSLLAITWLFVDFTGSAQHHVGFLAKWQFLPAVLALNVSVILALLLLTRVFGRIYCSVVCPLGILQDLLAHLHIRIGNTNKKKKIGHRYSYSPEVKWLRYSMLVLFIIALVAGVGSIVALLAPYSSFGRIAANLFKPIYEFANNILADRSAEAGNFDYYHVDIWVRSVPVLIISASTLLILTILAILGGRTYCNTICPVGTVLSFISRFSLLKINFDADKCRNCSACSKACKASCIDYKNHTVDYSRCVVCGNCLEACKFGALKYDLPKMHKLNKEQSSTEPSSPSRRAFLATSAMLTTAVVTTKAQKTVDGGLAAIEPKAPAKRSTPITPPGSLSAKHLAQHCTACQLCIAQCPNHVLRPSTDNWLTAMQPVMSYERGYCRPECTRCSNVCPTGAIRHISPEEKASTQIGHAVWNREQCVVLTDAVECGNCATHCPSQAITMVPLNLDEPLSPMIPAVNESRCIGCGACEYVCPARPSAIHVEGHEVHGVI
ncbi:MAG: 4Fe-4S binding protein [Bacteroidaceae bacterium]|nr:4Fe-4S binding protein [Bacteroidaceae bacterium]